MLLRPGLHPPTWRGFLARSLGVAAALAVVPGSGLKGQDPDLQRQILESQRRLEAIRQERARLQAEMDQIRGRVRNAANELSNIERQLSASRSVLAELDFQTETTASRAQEAAAELLRTRELLREGQAILYRRLRDIYKRGPLYSWRVLLGAESFGDLLNRYRYLGIMAAYDRSLVNRIARLEEALEGHHRQLQESLAELGRLRHMKLGEVAELRSVEENRQKTLQEYRRQEAQAQSRLQQLAQDEERLSNLLDELERRRREAEARARVAGGTRGGPTTLSAADAGKLDWPVEGELLYRFGLERRPNGIVLRRNGIGIRAPGGTPVRAVREGTVVLAGPFEGYGPTVILSHGGGFYTLYLYLDEIRVVEGRSVSSGQVVGTVGGRGTPEGPHLEFQIRAPVAGGSPQAMDPLQWLRSRSP